MAGAMAVPKDCDRDDEKNGAEACIERLVPLWSMSVLYSPLFK